MIIEKRNIDLKYPHAIKQDKMRIVLDWLLEFRFSTMHILSQRIGQKKTNSNRFINLLVRQGFMLSFKNLHTNNERYFMLSSSGMDYLSARGRDISKAMVKVQNMGRYSQIAHDIAVQKVVLLRLNEYEEVIWDKNISLSKEAKDRPDALFFHKDGYWVALEYERWRKGKKRIFMSFNRHVAALKKNQYSGVFYVFDKKVDFEHYQNVFTSKVWPRYSKDKKSGQIKLSGASYLPDCDESLQVRKCFIFFHEPLGFLNE